MSERISKLNRATSGVAECLVRNGRHVPAKGSVGCPPLGDQLHLQQRSKVMNHQAASATEAANLDEAMMSGGWPLVSSEARVFGDLVSSRMRPSRSR